MRVWRMKEGLLGFYCDRKRIYWLFVLISISCFSVIDCGKRLRNFDMLPDKGNFISFTVEPIGNLDVTKENPKIRLIFQNISNKEIIFSEPNKLQANIPASLLNPIQFRPFELKIKGYSIRLKPNEIYEQILSQDLFDIIEYLGLEDDKVYEILFGYRGVIFESKGKRLTNSKPLLSNPITIKT